MLTLLRPSSLQQACAVVGGIYNSTRNTALFTLERCGLVVEDWFFTSVDLEVGGYVQLRLQFLRMFLFTRKNIIYSRFLGCVSFLGLAA
jgi:hypothetical protein